MTNTSNQEPITLESITRAIRDVERLVATLKHRPVAYHLPEDEIKAISAAATKYQYREPDQLCRIATIWGLGLYPCDFGRFVVFADRSFAPLIEGTYEYDAEQILPAPDGMFAPRAEEIEAQRNKPTE